MKLFSILMVAAMAAAGLAVTGPARAQDDAAVISTHGDWEIRCAPAPKELCIMTQSHKDAEGHPIAFVKILKLKDQALKDGTKIPAQMEVVVPLGVLLTGGMSVQIDAKEARTAPYRICSKAGCRIMEPITEAYVDELKGGSGATISFHTIDGKTLSAPISLKGFTAAFNELKPAN